MSESLGLSIGATNLMAARPGRQPVTRRSVLTLWANRPAEVGVPSENAELTSPNLTEAGQVFRGFVERVGDPVPLVAADGSPHRGEELAAEALEAISRTVDDGQPPSTVVIAVPAYWGPATVGALRGALRAKPTLAPNGVPPMLISDATAALAALQADPGLPTSGVVALCDFGGSGTNITLADAGTGLQQIGETVRFTDFSGEQIDQALLGHVLAGLRDGANPDPASTVAVGALTRLREECRLAKERLSAETATVVPAELPGVRTDIRLTRAELESLLAEPLAGFLDALGDALERNRIPAANLAAVATVGGGAAIPILTQRLSEELRVPVITTARPGLNAAIGAAVIAARGGAPDAPTGMAVAAADAPTGLAPAAWAAGTAGAAATESATDGSPSATFRALAWSQDDAPGSEPVPYSGEDYTFDYAQQAQGGTGARPMVEFEPTDDETALVDAPVPWYRRPPLLFGIAAALAAVAVGGLAITLTSSDSTPTTTTTRVTKPGEQPSDTPATNVAPPETVTITGSDGNATVSTVPPATTTTAATTTTSPTTTTTTSPTTTTTTTTTSTTTTTTTTTTPPTTTTTTRTTTTTPPPTTTTTVAPPTTTVAPPTTTAAPPPTTTVAPPPTTQPILTGATAPES
ncbi:Hsp70 family protein [Mycolicibacterium sp. CBM1]